MTKIGNYFSQVIWEAVGVWENRCVALLSDRLTGLMSLLSEGGLLSELSVCLVHSAPGPLVIPHLSLII